jgi:hypothetical protein
VDNEFHVRPDVCQGLVEYEIDLDQQELPSGQHMKHRLARSSDDQQAEKRNIDERLPGVCHCWFSNFGLIIKSFFYFKKWFFKIRI